MTCTLSTIISNIPNRVIEAQVFERTIPISEIRLFNNKITFVLSDTTRCYSSYFAPEIVSHYVGFIGWALLIFSLGWSISHKKWLPSIILLAYPLGAMLNISVGLPFQDIINNVYYWLGSTFGAIMLIRSSYLFFGKK